MKKITAEEVRHLFHYDPETGVITWLNPTSKRRKPGDEAGSIGDTGYRIICAKGSAYMGHRLAWLWMTGEWPKFGIDHRNGIPHDNRWGNLRDVPQSINVQNVRRARKDNKLGFAGVVRKRKDFRAQIYVNGRRLVLGIRKTPQEAHELYVEAKRRLHEGCTI